MSPGDQPFARGRPVFAGEHRHLGTSDTACTRLGTPHALADVRVEVFHFISAPDGERPWTAVTPDLSARYVEVAVSSPEIVLLDLDGVLLNNDEYSPEFDRLAAAAFVPVLGGEAASWVRRHEAVWQRVQQRGWREYVAEARLRRLNLARWWDRVHAEWIEEACLSASNRRRPSRSAWMPLSAC